ncbi:geranyltranstransferase [Bacteroidales bacterium]|nr:geranyltranstransferase [Bacteroidales bacterium]
MISFDEAIHLVYIAVGNINYPEKFEGLYSPIRYILELKGKKIRPVLCILSYNMWKEDFEEVMPSAIAWEIFHNFTLMHDDLMDKADKRRGEDSVHKRWNENTAILSGDAMLILAYQHIASCPEVYLKELMDLFSSTAAEICEGQQLDLEFESRLEVCQEEYMEMIRLKTAVLLGASLKTGAIIGGASKQDAQLISEFGVNIGLAFQIMDDLLDVYGDPKLFGKNKGGDIVANKKTFFLLKALEMADSKTKECLKQWLKNTNQEHKEDKINAITAIYDDIGIKKMAEDKIKSLYLQARNSLAKISVEEDKKYVLSTFAEQLMNRKI